MVRSCVVASMVALLVAAACQAETPKPVTPTQPASSLVVPSPQPSATAQAMGPDDALRAVFSSPGVSGSSIFAAFPKSVGSQSCDIHGGGPFPGIVIPGTCRTEVYAVSGSGYVVNFTEAWDASRFHAQDDPSSGELRATWSFTVSPTGAVVSQPPSGNFPPQMVR